MQTFPVGTKVRFKRDAERYPHFIVPAGATGEVVISDEDLYAVRLDAPLEGAEAWDNEVHWYPSDWDVGTFDPSVEIEVASMSEVGAHR